jgi:hypothetical protein
MNGGSGKLFHCITSLYRITEKDHKTLSLTLPEDGSTTGFPNLIIQQKTKEEVQREIASACHNSLCNNRGSKTVLPCTSRTQIRAI